LREGRLTLGDAYGTIFEGDVVLKNLHIPHFRTAAAGALDPDRDRRLLLHKREIRKIIQALQQKGLTLIPLTIYFKRGLVKIELALARGRRQYDKREAIARRESEREMKRATKRSKQP
ncbi:MAG: SsrA-binding protein SmpB, partial [Candidatus Zixiibacteriota bacterium]